MLTQHLCRETARCGLEHLTVRASACDVRRPEDAQLRRALKHTPSGPRLSGADEAHHTLLSPSSSLQESETPRLTMAISVVIARLVVGVGAATSPPSPRALARHRTPEPLELPALAQRSTPCRDGSTSRDTWSTGT